MPAAAGLWTTPGDLIRVAREMCAPQRVLAVAARDEMLTPNTPGGWGLGWTPQGRWFRHLGNGSGFSALIVGTPTTGQATVVMTNGDSGSRLREDLVATVAEAFDWPDYLDDRATIELGAATLDSIAGRYELMPDYTLVVRRVGKHLYASAPGMPYAELFAQTPIELLRLDLDATTRCAAGSLTIDLGDDEVSAPRGRAEDR